MITEHEVYKESVGLNVDGSYKAGIIIKSSIIKDGAEVEEASYTLEQTKLRISRNSSCTMIDLVFRNRFDPELDKVWSMIESFRERHPYFDAETEERPILSLTFFPFKYEGEYFVTGADALCWTLIPIDETKDLYTIRVIFFNDNVLTFNSPDTSYDLAEMEEAVEETL